MRSTDAETGKIVSAREHYDRLIAAGNDPTLDPPVMAEHMNRWDGEALFEQLCLTPGCRVLEIGVGTGRLALRALERGCMSFTGMDISRPTLARAAQYLSGFEQVTLLLGEFPKAAPAGPFDRIYSSLTFLHIADKQAACIRVASLLAPGGRCVISLDKDRTPLIDMTDWSVVTYPDSPETICHLLSDAGLTVHPVRELEAAYLVTAEKPPLNC